MSGKRASDDDRVELDYQEQSDASAERGGDGSPFDRRNYLKFVGAAVATAATGAGVSTGKTSRHGITFDRVVDAVDDLGLDPSGGAPINDGLDSALSEGTLVRFPAGEYKVNGEIVVEEDRVGFLGEGDVRLVPSTGFAGRLFEHVGIPDDVLIENVDIDIRADGTTAGIRLKCRNHFHIQDVEFLGRGLTTKSGQVSAFMLGIENESGRGVLKNAVAKKGSRIDGYAGGDGRIGVWVGWSNRGTVRIEGCDFREFGNNGTYTSRTPGNVEIVDSYFLNNNGANVHIAGDGSYVENCTIEIDMQKYTGPPVDTSSGFGLRGIMIEQGVQIQDADPIPAGAEIRNCELVGTDAPGAIAMILLSSTGRSVNIVDTRIKCDIDRTWAVRRERPGASAWRAYQQTPPKPHWVRMDGVSITGSASKTEAVFLDEADDSVIRNCCIEQSGSSRGGVRIVNANGCVVENSTINVTGTAVDLENCTADTTSISESGSCPLPNWGGTASETSTENTSTTAEEPRDGSNLEIDGEGGDDVVEYSFSVAGSIEPGEGADEWDLVDGNSAIGQVGSGRDDFWVEGEFTEFELDGDAVVRLDGETVDPASLVD